MHDTKEMELSFCLRQGLCLALLAAVAAPARPQTTPAIRQGRMASVVLLDVGRLDHEAAARDCPGSVEALRFIFLVARQPTAQGLFTVTETRDFQLENRSYREDSARLLGDAIEPVTIIDDVPDFVASHPDLVDRIPGGFQADATMTVVVGGAALPGSGQGQVTAKVGWGGDTEPFVFPFALPAPRLRNIERPQGTIDHSRYESFVRVGVCHYHNGHIPRHGHPNPRVEGPQATKVMVRCFANVPAQGIIADRVVQLLASSAESVG